MLNKDFDFFRHPGWEEITRQIRYEITQAKRPANEIILDDPDVCQMLKVSKRTTATLRADKDITFHKCGGKILYKLSDVLEYVERNRVEAAPLKSKSRFK